MASTFPESSFVNYSHNTFNAANVTINTSVNAVASSARAKLAEKQRAIQRETHDKIATGTCQWILQDPLFKEWLSHRRKRIWGVGMPGAGKTLLVSFIIRHLQDLQASRGASPSLVVFVYCRYDDGLSLSALLMSLLQQFPGCGGLQPAGEILPALADIKSALRSAITGRSQSPVFMVVDALDELEDSIREDLVDFLLSFEQQLFLTSREIHLSQLDTFDLQIQAPTNDFRSYVSEEIRRRPKLRRILDANEEEKAKIVELIVQRSSGMFLLCSLQVAALKGVTTMKALKKAIELLPTTLRGTYELTLARVCAQSDDEQRLALKALLWVTYSTRLLHIQELCHALSVESDAVELEPEAIPDPRTLIDVACGLLSLHRETGTIRLTHYTTNDFIRSLTQTSLDDPHTFIATIAAAYLYSSKIDRRTIKSLHELTRPRGELPFLRYAFMNLGHHTHQSNLRHPDLPTALQINLARQRSFLVFWPADGDTEWDHVDECTLTHFASFHGIHSLLWSGDPNLKEMSRFGATPIFFAALNGHESLVKKLVEISPSTINIQTKSTFSPLMIAAKNGHTSVVRHLLDAGASSNTNNRRGCTPLHLAASEGHEECVRLLLQYGSEIDFSAITMKWGRIEPWGGMVSFSTDMPLNAADLAAMAGHDEIVVLLRSAGVDSILTNHPAMKRWQQPFVLPDGTTLSKEDLPRPPPPAFMMESLANGLLEGGE